MSELNEIHKKFQEYATNTFPDYPGLSAAWKADIKKLKQEKSENTFQPSQSLKAFLVILDKISNEQNLNWQDIDSWIYSYKNEIRDFVIPYIQFERNQSAPISHNQELVTELLNQSFIESGSALLYHKLRETISKNDFVVQTEYPTAKIQEKTVQATAQVRDDGNTPHLLSSEEIQQWKNLTAQAITSMDDLTADIFDIISILWMKQASHKDQMINFHTDDALNLRQVQGRKELSGYQTSYRKKERDDIMKRLAALTTIWIRIERDNLKFVDVENNEIDELEQVQFNPLFILDSITVAYRDSKPVGIYECKIKPGELLANFLYGSKKSSGLLALKTLQYNPVKQKFHKRLARYLSWQWRIRQKGADYLRPYSIGGDKGLLNVMGIEENTRYGSRVRDQFENILDTLQQDGVIREWLYLGFDESIIEKNKRWFEEVWLLNKVQIIPPDDITESARENQLVLEMESQQYDEMNFAALLKNMTESEVASTSETILEVTPENIRKVRVSRNLKLAAAAKEIGIAHTTLSRYENGKILNPTQANLNKMKSWMNQPNQPKRIKTTS
ncbi:XRE family transcriptional regulator [Neobacillus notoginsengisoli]|uniref:XRE family transcriptional regulator n=1 Tax=Neobacillus notoginsengisoli TaxID=1578198 RepID=A0A417YQ89_9BACI|nr:helix-turn-helix transcriptional regulator [Neobacillus notoginsengisoli]RHW36002.1 XRE family transcriptional regulator [Neobacillus notoginsengisoli]